MNKPDRDELRRRVTTGAEGIALADVLALLDQIDELERRLEPDCSNCHKRERDCGCADHHDRTEG